MLNQPVDTLGIHGLYEFAVRIEEVVGTVDTCEVPAMAVNLQLESDLRLTQHYGLNTKSGETLVLQCKCNILRISHGLDVIPCVILKAHIESAVGRAVLHNAVQVILFIGNDDFFVKSLDRGQVITTPK